MLRQPRLAQQIAALPPVRRTAVEGCMLAWSMVSGGAPPIVLLGGAGGPIEGWARVHAGLCDTGAAVFAYNRPGVGGSDKPRRPQDGETVVADLRALLREAGLQPPYVLVGHSLGGLFANLYARRVPLEVAGVVMLDATAPQDIAVMAATQGWVHRTLLTLTDLLLGRDGRGETAQAARTVQQIEAAGPFPDLPLLVLTGGRQPPAWQLPPQARDARCAHQRLLARLSPRGRQVVAEASGHFPQFSEPARVVQAVREVWEQARRDAAALNARPGSSARS